MNDEILEKWKEKTKGLFHLVEWTRFWNYIINLQEENEGLKEQNNDLRKIYRHTYNWLFENGNDELARYFQAQINDCPTFYVEPIIDYHKEWLDYKSIIEKAVEITKDLKQFVYDELVDRNVSGATETHSKIIDLLNILKGEDNE